MANITVIVWEIITDYNAPYDADYFLDGNYIHCLMDDTTFAISTQVRDASGAGLGTLLSSPTSGPNLFYGDGGTSIRLTADPLYQFCDTTTLKKINPLNTWPYAYLGSVPDALECAIVPVCDLNIDSYVMTTTSGPSNADGSIVVTASSSNGIIRYSMTEGFEYLDGQTGTTFSSLLPGFYTIYARDEVGCTDSIEVEVTVTKEYEPLYRIEYCDTLNSDGSVNNTRIDIEERAYTGAVTEICAGDTPFVLRYKHDQIDKYQTIVPSEADIQLLSETSEQFAALFTDDDQKYRVKFYKYESAAWVLKWVGYVVPQFYSEPYLSTPFVTTITASDNLGLLSTEDFSDVNGNDITGEKSMLNILATVLQKTGLELSIRIADDVYSNSFAQTASDDPWNQAYIDTRIFYNNTTPDKASVALSKLINAKGCKLFQSLGVWWIRRNEIAIGTMSYREFDYQGTYVSNSTISTRVNLGFGENNYWTGASQILQYTPAQGTIQISQDLGYDGNIIDSGSFESEYITQLGTGNYFFQDWNIFVGQAGTRYGYESVENGTSLGALYIDFTSSSGTDTTDTAVYSKKIRIDGGGQATFKFQYQVSPKYNVSHIPLNYVLKITSPDTLTVKYFFATSGDGGEFIDDTAGDDDWNDKGYKNQVIVTNYNRFETIEKRFLIPASTDGWDLEIFFYFNNLNTSSLLSGADYANLKAIDTTTATGGRLQGLRRYYYRHTGDTLLYDYTLEPSTEVESTPDIVRPTDYGVTNQSVWRRQNTYVPLGRLVDKILIDNVTVSQKIYVFTPVTALVTPPDSVDYENVVNSFNFNTYSATTYIGDLPDITNANYIYRGYIRESDGTPTVTWTRSGQTEEKLLMTILLEDFTAQMSSQMRKLSGTFLGKNHVSYVNSLNDILDSSKYMIGAYELDDKRNTYRVDLFEVGVGNDGEAPPDIVYEFTEEFTTEFDA